MVGLPHAAACMFAAAYYPVVVGLPHVAACMFAVAYCLVAVHNSVVALYSERAVALLYLPRQERYFGMAPRWRLGYLLRLFVGH